ncbi:MAG TPA: hypothetical protein VJ913_04330 [Actinomycetota bacterium]|nr:hypothetical protein [Actinomycetota bacterium]
MSDERLAASLAALGRELAYPPTPLLGTAVTARITAPASARPVLPGRALWSRRRVLVLVAVGVFAAIAIAAAARLAIGAFEIRVQPGATPSASQPPVQPDVLGDPVPPEEAAAAAGYEPALPAGPVPDEAYVVDSPFGDPGLLYVWRPSDRYPRIPGAEWGLVLMAFQGDSETVIKSVEAFENVRRISVDGRPAFWVTLPHVVAIETERGTETFAVRGNVLVWQGEDGLSYRMETALDQTDAVALAESFR